MASPNLSEIITTTLRNRSGQIADNVSNGNALLMKLKENGNSKPASGREIVQELDYAEGTFSWYTGYEVIDITPADVITAATYDWKQAAASVSASGLEVDVQNTGKEAILNLLEARITNAQRTMRNQITAGLYADGTGNSGKEIEGLQKVCADAAGQTVGDINSGTYTFWECQRETSTASATNIQSTMNTLMLECTRGTDKPNMIMADSAYYGFYWSSLQSNQRFTSDKEAGAGFTNLVYGGNVPVIYEDAGIPASHMYFLNTDYLFMRYSANRNFTPLDKVNSINQDALVQLIAWAGNLTTSNRSLQGVMLEA